MGERTTNREQLLSLAERCEKASGPDRELDFEIWFMRRDKEHLWALSGMNAQRPLWTEDDLKRTVKTAPGEYGFGASYTTSLDAAITLGTPRHIEWCDGFVEACCFGDEFDSAVYTARATTAALALTAASLRALAQGGEK